MKPNNDNRPTNDSIVTKSSRYSTDRTTDGLISRQDAIKEAYPVSIDGEVFDVVQVETLMGLPSAQPEVIRCKDCKYMTEHYDTDGNVPYWTCSEWDSGTDYDGFCHYAERRTDDEQRSS